MNELMILGQLGPFTLTAYGLCLLGGAAAALLLTILLGKKRLGVDASLSLYLAAAAGALIGARLVYCLTMIEFILVDLGGAGFLVQPWQGGYNMYGAIWGGLAGAAIYARATRRSVGEVLDLAVPGGALAIAAGRVGEAFTSQGLGHYVETEALQIFPFAVQNTWEDWQLPVFAYEALAALIILVIVVKVLGKARRSGAAAEIFLTLISLCQIMLESMRADEFIRFGFVKFNMLAAALTLGGVFFLRIRRFVLARGWNKWQTLRIVLFALGIIVVILIEFALDKSPIDNRLLYVIMALMLGMMGVSMLRESK